MHGAGLEHEARATGGEARLPHDLGLVGGRFAVRDDEELVGRADRLVARLVGRREDVDVDELLVLLGRDAELVSLLVPALVGDGLERHDNLHAAEAPLEGDEVLRSVADVELHPVHLHEPVAAVGVDLAAGDAGGDLEGDVLEGRDLVLTTVGLTHGLLARQLLVENLDLDGHLPGLVVARADRLETLDLFGREQDHVELLPVVVSCLFAAPYRVPQPILAKSLLLAKISYRTQGDTLSHVKEQNNITYLSPFVNRHCTQGLRTRK